MYRFHRVVFDVAKEVFANEKLGKSMQLKCQNYEQDEEEMMLSEENVKHQEMRRGEMGVI